MPLVLLLTAAVSGTPASRGLGAYFLMYSLFELIIVDNGPDLPIAVGGPEGGLYLSLAAAHVLLVLVLCR